MRWVDSKAIDQEKWSLLIDTHPGFRHYYEYEYLSTVAKQWGALVWDDYQTVWPLCIKRLPLPQIYQPLSAQQLGPMSVADIESNKIDSAINWMQKRFWRIDVKFNSYYTNQLNIDAQNRTNIELDLSAPYADLVKRYNRNALSNIKKATGAKVEIECHSEFMQGAIEAFKQGKGKSLPGISEAYYHEIERVFKTYLNNGKAETWVASLNQKPIAYLMLLKSQNRILNLFTSTTVESKSMGAMHALIDAALKKYADSPWIFDFEGSEDKNLAFFYKSFGGESKIYLHYYTGWRVPILSK